MREATEADSVEASSLDHLLLLASSAVLPPNEAGVVLEAGEGLRVLGATLRCRFPRTAFFRLRRGAAGAVSYEVNCPALGGLRKTWTFESPRALAEVLLEHLPDSATDFLAHARATALGEIVLLTKEQMARQQQQGQLHCPDCGEFFIGERGLQDHQRRKHHKAVPEALDVVHWSRLQLVPVPAKKFFWQEGAQTLPAKRDQLDPVLCAARAGDLATLQGLAADGWDLQTRDRHGSNALLWAAGGGHLEVCQRLVIEGLDPHAQQKDGRTALHWAARNGHLRVCQWLVQVHNLPANGPTSDGTVPLHWAVWQGHEDVCSWLIHEARADLHAKNKYGCNASQWAALAGSVPMCQWLQREGLDLKVLNLNGHSALHKAAVKGQWDCCAWLLSEETTDLGGGGLGSMQLGADRDGNTPSTMARCGGFEDLAKFLKAAEHSASFGAVSQRQKTFSASTAPHRRQRGA